MSLEIICTWVSTWYSHNLIYTGIHANAVGWLAFGVSTNGLMDSGGNGSDIAMVCFQFH